MIVELYTRKSPPCAFCQNAKVLLKSKDIEYSEYVVGEDLDVDRLKEAFPDQKTLPVVVIDNKLIGGFQELRQFLDNQNTLGDLSL
jgi:glutaredoxin